MGKEQEDKHRKLEELGFKRGLSQGETIEAQRERWAARIRARMPEGVGGPPFVEVVEKEKEEVTRLPDLSPEAQTNEGDFWVKYDPTTGEVVTFRWIKPKTIITKDKKQKLPEAENFVVIKSPRDEEVDLEAMPKSWLVVKLVPQHVWDGLETAMRQQDYLIHDYHAGEGIEQERVENLFSAIYDLTQVFVEGDLTEDDLNRVARQTQKLLEKEGLTEAKDDTWKRLADSTKRAAQKDKLYRINPGRARFLLRSAYLDNVRREVVTRLVREKANQVFGILFAERIITRTVLENATEMIDELFEHSVFTHHVYGQRERIPDQQITEVREILKGIVDVDLRRVRLEPYLLPSRLAEVMLMGTYFRSEREIEELGEVLRLGNVADEINNQSVEDYLMKRDTESAARRLRHAQSVIKSVLDDSDHKVYKVYD